MSTASHESDPAATLLLEASEAWTPTDEHASLDLSAGRVAAVANAVGLRPADPGTVPAFWPWLCEQRWSRPEELNPDGHPTRGGLLPPLPERTRMFVGGRLDVRVPLRPDLATERHSRVVHRRVKQGRSGTMLFVTVRHEIVQSSTTCVVDEQDVMYRSGRSARAFDPLPTEPPRPGPEPWQRPWSTHPTLLFAFSALSANSHRIHYDRPYTEEVEGYPGLVVHGPLEVLVLAELAREHAPEAARTRVDYALTAPLICGVPALLCGGPGEAGSARLEVRTATATTARAQVSWVSAHGVTGL